MCFTQSGLATLLENLVGGVRQQSLATEAAQVALVALHGALQQWEQQVESLTTCGPVAGVFCTTVEALQHLTHAVVVIDQWLDDPADDTVEDALQLAYQAEELLQQAHNQASGLVEQLLDDEAEL